ncbi:MAG: class I SAM-dependent methyltransferase [Rhodospirillaceae bacterium]|nr:class I SAM-dependent methyltransferase [Rhodospirillaceae bacterium]
MSLQGFLAEAKHHVTEPIQEKHKIWDSYWHDSRIFSTVAESSPQAEATLEAHWAEFFNELPNGAAILDLGCGNGHVCLMAARASEATGKHFRIFGVDSAAIDPVKFVPKEELLKTVEFKGQVPMEVLPYQSGQFDAVVSQYGMEFGDSRAPAEAVRVMKRGAKFCAIMFAANTAPVVQVASKMRQSQFLLNGTKLFEVATAVSQALHHIEKSPQEDGAPRDTKKYLQKFSDEVERTMAKFKNTDSEIVEAVITSLQHVFVIRKTTEINSQVNMIALMKKRIGSHVARLDAITRAAVGDSGLLGFKRKLADAGLMGVAHSQVIVDGVGVIGVKVTGTR